MKLVPGTKFKIVDDCVVSKNACFKISKISQEGIFVWDVSDNGVDVEILIKWEYIK